MRTILITYIIVINLTGFLLMGIDKRRAVRNRWRISERTLFLTALLFGCAGVWIGMHVFRHKTKHRTFRIGLPVLLILQLLLLISAVFLYLRHAGSPAQVVRRELKQIQSLDTGTIQAFISYEDLMNSHSVSADADETGTEAVTLFFRNFDYQIEQEEIDSREAAVTVNITNIDMHSLAQDLCKKILQASVSVYSDSTISTTGDYYRLLRDTLSENTYEITTTSAVFHLRRENSAWVIQSDDALEDALVSGFISCMNDPYILPAATALSIHLDALKALTAEQWADYLSINDLFATYNTDYSQLIDQEYIRQLAAAFDYEILRCVEDGRQARASVRITSIDMKNVLAIYKRRLLSYASTTQSLRDDPVQFSNETSRLLLESLQENKNVASTDIDISFRNNGSIWDITFDQEFTNALMGNMSGAIDQFNSVTHESESGTVIVAPVD